MNSLADPTLVEVLDRLYREADEQTPELCEKVAGLRRDGQMPDDWAEQLRDYYLPVRRQ